MLIETQMMQESVRIDFHVEAMALDNSLCVVDTNGGMFRGLRSSMLVAASEARVLDGWMTTLPAEPTLLIIPSINILRSSSCDM
jgi:hypothetical protein